MVIATITQIHIYNEKYINTPLAIIDGRNDVRIIMLGKKYLLFVDMGSIWIYTYNGRLHLNPKYIGSQLQIMNLTIKSITFGLHYLAIRDYADQSGMTFYNNSYIQLIIMICMFPLQLFVVLIYYQVHHDKMNQRNLKIKSIFLKLLFVVPVIKMISI